VKRDIIEKIEDGKKEERRKKEKRRVDSEKKGEHMKEIERKRMSIKRKIHSFLLRLMNVDEVKPFYQQRLMSFSEFLNPS
jgi:hypothetical protein